MSLPAFDGNCPSCSHTFTLAQLKEMAVGDGWQRYLTVIDHRGVRRVVSFDEFNPASMEPHDGAEH
jgi:hypothetical protein